MDDLQQRMARVEQKVEALDQRVNEMGPVRETVAKLGVQATYLQSGVTDLRKEVAEFRQAMDTREDDARKERRTTNLALASLAVMILCALIGAAVVILSSTHA